MQEKQNIGSLFNRIAHSYDTVNHVLSLNIDKRWRRKTVNMLPERRITNSSLHVRDVAIGTAELASETRKRK